MPIPFSVTYPPSVIVDEKGCVPQLWPAATEAVTGMFSGDALGDGVGVGVCPIQLLPLAKEYDVGVPIQQEERGEQAAVPLPVPVDGQKLYILQPAVMQQAAAQKARFDVSLPPTGSGACAKPSACGAGTPEPGKKAHVPG